MLLWLAVRHSGRMRLMIKQKKSGRMHTSLANRSVGRTIAVTSVIFDRASWQPPLPTQVCIYVSTRGGRRGLVLIRNAGSCGADGGAVGTLQPPAQSPRPRPAGEIRTSHQLTITTIATPSRKCQRKDETENVRQLQDSGSTVNTRKCVPVCRMCGV